MLLTSVIVVLREVLEASVLIGILLALCATLGISRRWIMPSMILGGVGAVISSLFINTISDWFEGVGQEIVNACIQSAIYALLLFLALSILRNFRRPKTVERLIPVTMMLIVALATSREGLEIIIYVHGFTNTLSQSISIFIGTAMGAAIGVSIGILVYYLLSQTSASRSPALPLALLGLIGSGVLSQAILLLIQADWIIAQLPLWDTSAWLMETSLTGQLLYVLIGYEATPTPIQAAVYLVGLIILWTLSALVQLRYIQSEG